MVVFSLVVANPQWVIDHSLRNGFSPPVLNFAFTFSQKNVL